MLIGISGKLGSGKDTVGLIIQYLIYSNKNGLGLSNGEIEYTIYHGDAYLERGSSARVKKKQFATKIKHICALLLGCHENDFERQDFKSSYLPKMWDKYEVVTNDVAYLHSVKDVLYPTMEEASAWIQLNIPEDQRIHFGIMTRSFTVRWFIQTFGTEAMRDKIHPLIWINSLFADYRGDEDWVITDVRLPDEARSISERAGTLIRVNRGPQKATWETAHSTETALDNYKEFHYIIENEGSILDLVQKCREVLLNEKLITEE